MRTATLVAAGVIGILCHGQAWAAPLGEADRSFLVKERRGAAYELESAKLAAAKASRPDVKSYAEKLVHDHEIYNAALDRLGDQQGVRLPTEPDAADKARMADLARLGGAAFDALYVREAIRINAEDKRDGDAEKAATGNQAIKYFMAKFSDMDDEHEKLARQLEARK